MLKQKCSATANSFLYASSCTES